MSEPVEPVPAQASEDPVYEDDIDAAPVQMPSWRQEEDSGPRVVPLSDPTIQIPEEDGPLEPLDGVVSPEFESLTELSTDVGPAAPERTGSGGSRLVRVGPPPNVPTASTPMTGPLGAGGGWGDTHGEAARPAHRLPAPAPQRAPQARASASRCVLGAILMILWLAATGYLVHLM